MKKCIVCARKKDPRSFSKSLAFAYMTKKQVEMICNSCMKKTHPER